MLDQRFPAEQVLFIFRLAARRYRAHRLRRDLSATTNPQLPPRRRPSRREPRSSSLRAVDGGAYLNRELSWLEFNRRVLALADESGLPLLERVKFLAIFSSNLDEFFQVRVAAIVQQIAARRSGRSPDGLSPKEQLKRIRGSVSAIVARQSRVFSEQVMPALAQSDIRIVDWLALDDDDRSYLGGEFERRIFPVLTPLAVDPGHPFPHVSSLSLNLAVIVRDSDTGERRFARVKVPPLLERFVAMPDGRRFVAIESVIAANLDRLFPGMAVDSACEFRVTRDAGLDLEEGEADDLLEAIDVEIRRRRFGRPVRLEIASSTTPEVVELLLAELDLNANDVYMVDGLLALSDLWGICGIDRPDLKHRPGRPVTPPDLVAATDAGSRGIFAILRERDVLVHHPYESFPASVEAFVSQAANDPKVLAIKQTLYRTSGDSAIAESLIEAAEQGKQVVVLVELKARFDEQANIAWARALEEAGVHVVYGLVGLKTHTKTTLVLRDEGDCVRSYCHIGTGNYNRTTARIYEDIGLFSADPDLGADLGSLFNYLTGYSHHVGYRRLLVANTSLRTRLVEMIRSEMEDPDGAGRIVMKMNSLVDDELIDALYEASAAGVRIDLIVRGICCLRPGVSGLSENIAVRSIVGRYLEHSRIFAFGERRARTYFIGSADLMPRNLDHRVEVVTPVEDPRLKSRIQEILDVNLADDTLAWDLAGDGSWQRVPTRDGADTHLRLAELAAARTSDRVVPAPNLLGN